MGNVLLCPGTCTFSVYNGDCVLLFVYLQRLAGATLLVFANKQDLPGAMSADEIRVVSSTTEVTLISSGLYTHSGVL